MSQLTKLNHNVKSIVISLHEGEDKKKQSLDWELSKSYFVPLATRSLFLSYEITQKKENFNSLILNGIKNDKEMSLGEKINFSEFILENKDKFLNDRKLVQDFMEEEGHVCLLNWVWKKNNSFKIKLSKDNLNLYSIIEINIILVLLKNILNIFDFLPIKSKDILELKFYEKLLKLKNLIKLYSNFNLLNLIDKILQKWKAAVDTFYDQTIISCFLLNHLNIKRQRPKEEDDKEDKDETEADSEAGQSFVKFENSNLDNKININKTKTKKHLKVSFDFSLNSIKYFNQEDAPINISQTPSLYC